MAWSPAQEPAHRTGPRTRGSTWAWPHTQTTAPITSGHLGGHWALFSRFSSSYTLCDLVSLRERDSLSPGLHPRLSRASFTHVVPTKPPDWAQLAFECQQKAVCLSPQKGRSWSGGFVPPTLGTPGDRVAALDSYGLMGLSTHPATEGEARLWVPQGGTAPGHLTAPTKDAGRPQRL